MTALAPVAIPGADLGLFGLIVAAAVLCAVCFVLLCLNETERHNK